MKKDKRPRAHTLPAKVCITKLEGKGNEHVQRGLEQLLQTLGSWKNIVPPHTKKVLIKPNLMMGEHWTTGITVHPFLIELLVCGLRDQGLDVIVGEGAGWGCDSADSFRETGVTELCRRLDVPLVDFKRGRGVKVPVPDGELLKDVLVDEVVTECDFIISLAKLKTHGETLVTLSLKNMKGLIAEDRDRLRFHLLDVNRCLVDLNRAIKPDFAIVEGIVALEGIGPLQPGKPRPLGILVGGSDALAVDTVCTEIIGMHAGDIRHLVYAGNAGIGTNNMDDIEVMGESIESVAPAGFELPPTELEGLSPFENIRIVNGNPCSNCIASLAACLHGYIDKRIVEGATHNVDILVGAKAKPAGERSDIAIGNCLKRYRGKIPFVPGCPPTSDAYLELIKRGLKGDFRAATVDSRREVIELENP